MRGMSITMSTVQRWWSIVTLTEHDWHKAYYESGFERTWFRLWYLGQEPWP